jgi:hypothetical protein
VKLDRSEFANGLGGKGGKEKDRTDLLLRKEEWGKVAVIGGGDQSEWQESIWTLELAYFPLLWFLKVKKLYKSLQVNGSQLIPSPLHAQHLPRSCSTEVFVPRSFHHPADLL